MSIPLQHILFLDIETVSQQRSFDLLDASWQSLWQKKSELLLRNRENETAESIYSRAAIYAEFGKIICISCGVLSIQDGQRKFTLKSFAGNDERQLLIDFTEMLRKWSGNEARYLCAHNGKEFDFPYLCRRMIIQRIPIPYLLQIAGKKPWEITHIDTMELWKFGDYKSFTSLNLLAHTLGIPTPKDDIDGSQVGELYWSSTDNITQQAAIDRIKTYCQKDVLTVAQLYLRMQGEELLASDAVEIRP